MPYIVRLFTVKLQQNVVLCRKLCMASYCKLLTINVRISPDIEDHVIKYTPDSMILKSEISPKTFETLKKVKSRTGFFGVAEPLI